jgi:site-specific recombinase XerD
MFQHGLRVSDACGIKLYRVDTESSVLHVFGFELSRCRGGRCGSGGP